MVGTTTVPGAQRPTRLPRSSLRRVVDLALRAPSVHNTQPWRWQLRRDGLELWADRTRALPHTDAHGRALTTSCGCALHHALVAAEALGLATETDLFPLGQGADLLARVRLTPGLAPPDAGELIGAISERRTDRRRFTHWPVTPDRVDHLARTASVGRTIAVPLLDPELRLHVESLSERAREAQERDPGTRQERLEWLDRSSLDGVPAAVLPEPMGYPGERPTRYGASPRISERTFETGDGVLALSTPQDDPPAWLATGVALSALWLQATREGLSVVPLSQVTEVPSTRRALRDALGMPHCHPQMLVRVGWLQIGRDALPQTPRRSLRDVLGE